MQVPRWHFKMLNDKPRNLAYKKAIERAFNKNVDSVIDIGCGCGFLSMLASKGPNIKKTYAVESSKALCKIAKNAFEANGVNVNLINDHSTKLNDGTIKGNLIVTEIFDAALFGEHMLDTLIHALENLVEENFEIIPCSATVYVTGISSEQLLESYQVCHDYPEIKLKGKSVRACDPYAVEDLSSACVDYLTETMPIINIDFKDIDTLKKFAKDPNFQPEVVTKCIKNGTIDAIAVWFDLHLDETITLTTDPFEPKRAECWEQAIFYIKTPKEVKENEDVTICSTIVDNKLQLSLSGQREVNGRHFPVSQDIITFLNDEYLMKHVKTLARHFQVNADSYVMDFHPFPLFGLMLAKQGATLYCQAKHDYDKVFIERVARVNKIKKMNIITYEQAFYVREQLEPLDVLFLPPISPDGTVDESNLGLLPIYSSKLKADGIHVVKNVLLHFQIVHCDYLDKWNRVDDNNLCGFKVATFFEEFQATEHACIDCELLNYKAFTAVIRAGDVLEGSGIEKSMTMEVKIKNSGMANAILYWYDFVCFDNSHIDTRNSTHYRCAAFLFSKPVRLTANSSVKVIWKQNDASFSLNLFEEE